MKKLSTPSFLIKTLSFCVIFFLFPLSPVFGGAGTLNASFTADKATITVGETVTFTDMTTSDGCSGVVDTWNWSFGVDASPAMANSQGPHAVTYGSVGTKTITLDASDIGIASCDSDDFSLMISVTPAVPTLSEWGLILLALLLMNLGSVFIAQEKLALGTPRNFKLPFFSLQLPFFSLQLPFSAEHFNKAVILTAIFAFVGFVGSIALIGTIAASDLIGVFVTAPVFAYLVHLVWMLKEK